MNLRSFLIAAAMLATLLHLPNSSFAQYSNTGKDVASRFRPGIGWFFTGLRPEKENQAKKYDRLIVDITYNDWLGDTESLRAKPSSIGFGVNTMFDLPLGKNTSFGWGLGYQRIRIQHDQSLFTNPTDGFTQLIKNPTDARASFHYNQFSIPVELHLRGDNWKHLKIHVGGKVGIRTNMHEKTILNGSEGITKIKDYQFPDSNPLSYSAHVRFGLRNYALFAEYDFSPLFTNALSSEINVLRFGVSISLF